MNKKLLSALMLGMIAFGTASTVTSCKDYDSDISSLKQSVDANATAIANAQKDLQSKIDALKTEYEATKSKVAALETEMAKKADKTALDNEIARAQQKETALEQKIKDAEEALSDLKKLVDTKVDKTEFSAKTQELADDIKKNSKAIAENNDLIKANDAAIKANSALIATKVSQSDYDAEVKAIYSRIEAVEKDLAQAMKDIKTNAGDIKTNAENIEKNATAIDKANGTIKILQDGLKDEVTARAAADANLQSQIDALNAYKARVEANESAITALNNQITDILAELTQAKKDIAANSSSINDLTEKMNKLSEKVSTLSDNLNLLVVLVETSLRSMVFVPEFYYEGIEATEIETMNYNYYTLQAVDADKDGEFNLNATTTGKSVPDATSTDAKHLRYNSKPDFNVLRSVVTYHLNPSTADMEGATYQILTADKNYAIGRADETVKLTAKATKLQGGDLQITLGVDKPSLIKNIKDNQMVTVFATEATLPKKNSVATQSYTVTSDYAAITSRVRNGGYIISNVYKAAGNGELDATDAERKTMTGVLNTNTCGDCTYATATHAAAALHTFRTFEEAAYPVGKNVMPNYKTDPKVDAQATVAWNDSLDLRRLVETHTVADDQPVKVEKMKANNLTYKFEIVGSIYGSNETSEGAHAIIKKDGYTLRPQMPTTDGKQNKAENGLQAKTTVDRQPVVRVSLIDTEKNQVLDYGYIRIRIAATPEKVEEKADKSIEYTGATYAYKFNDGCTTPAFPAWNWSNTWNQVEYDLYHMLGISKETFDKYYKAQTATAAGKSYSGLAQYSATAVTGGYKFTLESNAIGTMSESINPGTSETTTLKWTVTSDQMKAEFGTKAPGKYNFSRAVKYESNDKSLYPDVYVYVKSGVVTISKVGKSSGKFTGLDNAKLSNYWYEHNKNKNGGKDESRINVYSPEDLKVASLKGQPFETVIASEFVENKIDAASMITVTDSTTDQSWAKSKLKYDLQFDKINEGRKYKGQTGTEYQLSVSSDGKIIYADIVSDPLDYPQEVACLTGSTVNSTKINYMHTSYAEDLLNYKKYDQMTDDFLLVTIGIIVKNQCGQTLDVTDNTFNERFVRPLNVSDNAKNIKDAATSKQIIKLSDLVSMTDWRGQWNPGSIDYMTYYNVKSITVRGASAGSSINGLITTNMDGGTLGTTKLSSKSNLVEFTYNPLTPATPSKTADYGVIEYTNNSQNVQTFSVQIPVRVSYEWGHIDTYVTVTVNETLGAKMK